MFVAILFRVWLVLGIQFLYLNILRPISFTYRIFVRDKQKQEKTIDILAHRYWAQFLLWQTGCSVSVTGQQNIPSYKPFIVVANHQSLYDIPILVYSLKIAIGFVAKHTLYRVPLLHACMKILKCLPLDRSKPRQAMERFRKHTENMRQSRTGVLVIFPEGTRNRQPWKGPKPFKSGSMQLFLEQGLTVLPVTIFGSEHNGRRFFNKVQVHIHPAQTQSTYKTANRQEISQTMHTLISDKWQQLKSQQLKSQQEGSKKLR